MPCLNEEKGIKFCIQEAQLFLKESGIHGEILIADNDSTDESVSIAKHLGARVIYVKEKGYGNALRAGIRQAQGKYIIMGDCDGSYDFYHLNPFINGLRNGADMVMGNRFAGGIEKGAMRWSHQYIGIPFLSWLGRIAYHTDVKDFHCGLRAFRKDVALSMNLKAEGMEFASEIIGVFAKDKKSIVEVPTVLRKDLRGAPSHLNTIRDGMRHVIFIMKTWKSV